MNFPHTLAPSNPKLHRLLMLVLTGAVCWIWGFVVLEVLAVIDTETSEDTLEPVSVLSPLSLLEVGDGSIDTNFRSPFIPSALLFPVAQTTQEEATERVEADRSAPPALLLIGVINDEVLLRDGRGRVHYLGVGDTLSGVRIEAVSGESIRLCYRAEVYELPLGG